MTVDDILRCGLCKQLVVEPFTASGCRHSFCRRCLGDLEQQKECANCHRELKPKELQPDFGLQDLVNSMEESKKKEENIEKKTNDDKNDSKELISLVLEFFPVPCSIEMVSDDDYEAPDPDEPSTSALPEPPKKKKKLAKCRQLPHLTSRIFRRYYRCPANTKLLILQKLLEQKLVGAETSTIHFVHNKDNKELDVESTLKEIALQSGWLGTRPFRLMFTLMENKDRPPHLDPEPMPCLQPEAPQEMATTCQEPSQIPRILPPPSHPTLIARPVPVPIPQKRRRTSDPKPSPPAVPPMLIPSAGGQRQLFIRAQGQLVPNQFLPFLQQFPNMMRMAQPIVSAPQQIRLPVAYQQNVVRMAPRATVPPSQLRPVPQEMPKPVATIRMDTPKEVSKPESKAPEITPFRHEVTVQPILNKSPVIQHPKHLQPVVRHAPVVPTVLRAQAISLKATPVNGLQFAHASALMNNLVHPSIRKVPEQPVKVLAQERKPMAAPEQPMKLPQEQKPLPAPETKPLAPESVKPLPSPIPIHPITPKASPSPAAPTADMDVATRAKMTGQSLGKTLKDSFKSTKSLLEIKQSPESLKQNCPPLVPPSSL